MRDQLPRAVEGSIRRYRLLRERDSVLVAVSGGADSVALVAALVGLRHAGWRIGIGHVNHRLRGEDSERDRRFVERLAAQLGCEVYVAEAPIRKGANLEERARERRYGALAAIAERERFRRIATAHTLDDQAETVLHRLLRGTGNAGLAAIARDRGDGVIRPLLDVSRREVLDFLGKHGLRHRIDRTNASRRFTRNRLRHRILPLLEKEVNPAAKRALARIADLAREDEHWLERAAARRRRRAVRASELNARELRSMPAALRRRVVRQWLAEVRGNLLGIELDHVERLDDLVAAALEGRSISLPGGRAAYRRGNVVWNPVANAGRWRIETRIASARPVAGRWRAVFDASGLDGEVNVGRAKPGDRIRPLGLGGSKKLQDVFVDGKVPREERAEWPVVSAADGTILWVPGLVRSDVAPVVSKTRRYLVIEARRSPPGGA